MCIATTPQRASAHSSAIPSSCNPEISLITSAPASSTAAATAAWRVSTEITASVHGRSSRTTGSTRSSSSSTETSAAPGLVDSPPMSRIRAPCRSSSFAWETARSTVWKRPPSEKESGVTFTIPISTPPRATFNMSRLTSQFI